MDIKDKRVIIDGNKNNVYTVIRGEFNRGNRGKARVFVQYPGYGSRGKPFNFDRITCVEAK